MESIDYQFDAHNAEYIEQLLEEYLRDETRVPPVWRAYFRRLRGTEDLDNWRPGPSFRPSSVFNPPAVLDGARRRLRREASLLQDRADQLVRAYRVRGHLMARLDPLGLQRAEHPELNPAVYGIGDQDLDRPVSTTSLGGPQRQTLRALIERLRNTYCRYIGAQFMHIDDLGIRDWLQQRMEQTENRLQLSRAEQLRILTRLTDAVIFEQFVRKKYVGAKTFSLEGAESLIPLLDLAIEKAGRQGIREIVLGMAHRGRLNVLANIIGKQPQEIFWEFEDTRPELHTGRGDVKYHLGFSGDWTTQSGQSVHLSLCFNPSHLEFVNPVALGRMRAKQDRVRDTKRRRGMVLLIHGDAAFAAEGVIQETLNLSQLEGYTTGGTLHVIVNNQIGFTTTPDEGRSTVYASDVAKMLQIPIFHVNGEHPEAVAQVVDLALDFRERFQRDCVIDMYCYRRWGHNEGDEPNFTQPQMYQAIDHRPSVRDSYLEHLLKLNEVTRDEADRIAQQRQEHLQIEFQLAQRADFTPRRQWLAGVWQGYEGGPEPPDDDPITGVELDLLKHLLRRLTKVPNGFHVHKKLQRFLELRRQMGEQQRPVDWATAEALAIASLAVEGHPVRLSGQDSARGTFSQRHAILHDVVDGHKHSIFQALAPHQAPVQIINSPLSEAAVLGFEYGYSLDYPEALVAWEAQFGDFWNAAQVIVDQFIASAEDKWRRLSGLVMLLPHGFEGQGPEHSSARLERFLNLTAEYNIQVANPSTPAQYFHLLRRQVLRRWRKPLVVLTPKSLLRHPACTSDLEALADGRFQRVLPDAHGDEREVRAVLLCSGKIYYELLEKRQREERWDLAVVRLEQLYPLPDEYITAALGPYQPGTPCVWVQEEPENMGAWYHLKVRFGSELPGGYPLRAVTRPPSASPATGSQASHRREQEELLAAAFQD